MLDLPTYVFVILLEFLFNLVKNLSVTLAQDSASEFFTINEVANINYKNYACL